MNNLGEIFEANAAALGLTNYVGSMQPDGSLECSFTIDGSEKQGTVDTSGLPENATNTQKHEFAQAKLRELAGLTS